MHTHLLWILACVSSVVRSKPHQTEGEEVDLMLSLKEILKLEETNAFKRLYLTSNSDRVAVSSLLDLFYDHFF